MLGIDRPYRVLVVCTANQCRSPMAAAVFARRMARARIRGLTLSAGTRVSEPMPATPNAIIAAREQWYDLTAHESAPVDRETLESADLVIGMTREHVREIVVMDPASYWRAFTLKALVRKGEASPRGRESFGDWLSTLAAAWDHDDLLGESPTDDVADPIGRPLEEFRETLAELEDLIARLVAVAWPNED